VGPDDVVLEVGPGLGSLTVGLLEVVRHVTAVEIDARLASQLPVTVGPASLDVICADALHVDDVPGPVPTALVANLPYNVSVPVLLHLLAVIPSLQSGLVLVQQEVADRLTAAPGSRTYGVPSAKLAWYAQATAAGAVPRSVFWPVPNVDSGLVRFTRRTPPPGDRLATFAAVDAAFAQRRKTLRAALATWAGSAARAEEILRRADVDPGARGETLDIAAFARIAAAQGS
jgi:16S rRNA (adenine1518-N6/adenine1519-N6)-dimethyltransferase